MTQTDGNDVLRRMVAAAAGGGEGGGSRPAMFPSRAVERAFARSLHQEFAITAEIAEITESAPDAGTIAADAGENALFILLEGPGGARGVAALSQPLAAALVLCRLTGRLPAEMPAPRPLSRADAAILRPLIALILRDAGAALAEGPGAPWTGGLTPGAHLADGRFLALSLPEDELHGFHLRLGALGGVDGATLTLALPAAPRPAIGRGEDSAAFQGRLAARLRGSELRIEAVLTRLTLPLSRLSALSAGETLILPGPGLAGVRLEAPGRTLVAEGRLGRMHGERAVKVTRLSGQTGQTDHGTGMSPALRGPVADAHTAIDPAASEV